MRRERSPLFLLQKKNCGYCFKVGVQEKYFTIDFLNDVQ